MLHTHSEIPDITAIVPCNHKETDYRMVLHTANATNNGATYTDVVALAVALSSLYKGCKIWVALNILATTPRIFDISAPTIYQKS